MTKAEVKSVQITAALQLLLKERGSGYKKQLSYWQKVVGLLLILT